MTSAIDVVDYIDTSAAAKLVVAESESRALRRYLGRRPNPPFTSDLTRTELLRATRRLDPSLATVARDVLDTFTIVGLPTTTFERAGLIDPPALRSLDALHLAAALIVGDDLDLLITYDERLIAAARASGVATASPAA
jgi:predicted nucleic acid-binding protein